jgi:hypothetical protein
MTLAHSADDLMHAVVHAVRAGRGFIGMFPTDDAEIVSELGLANLGEHDEIEISDTAFKSHLLEGTTVQDSKTILVPIAENEPLDSSVSTGWVYKSFSERRIRSSFKL